MKKNLPLNFIVAAILLGAAIFIFSCKKAETPTPTPTTPGGNNVLDNCDLKYILNYKNGYVWKYVFDSISPRKLVKAINLDDNGNITNTYHIFYRPANSDTVVVIQEWTGNFAALQYVDSFTYNTKGQFNLEKVYQPNFKDSLILVQYYKYYYDSFDGTIEKNESYSPSNTLLASKEYKYDINDEVKDVIYYDASHTETASEHYHRTDLLYGHFDIFENTLHREAWQHAPDTIALTYGNSKTVSSYILKGDNANYLVEADQAFRLSGVTDTSKYQTYQYQCFK